jgi:hypothetical protein
LSLAAAAAAAFDGEDGLRRFEASIAFPIVVPRGIA